MSVPALSFSGAPDPDERVPIVYAIYQSTSQANGGIESISRLVESLRRFRPVIVTQRETRATARWRSLGIDVHVWDIPDPQPIDERIAKVKFQSRRLLPWATANRRVAGLVAQLQAPVLHCNDILSFWHSAPGAISAGARVVFNVRDIFPPDVAYGLKWRATRFLADELVVLSNEMLAQLESRLEPLLPSWLSKPAPINAIYSAIDFARLSPLARESRAELRTSLAIESDEIAIGCVGSFCRKKNQLDYIERVVTKLARVVPKSVTYFIGDFLPEQDGYSQDCVAAVDRLGLSDRVRFVGFTQSMNQWYRALDLVCIASRTEGLARAMIESIACGTPVVSFDVCSAREILENPPCGKVVRQGDYDALVDAVASLALRPSDRATMALVGAEKAKRLFQADRSRFAYEDLYFHLAQRAGRQPRGNGL